MHVDNNGKPKRLATVLTYLSDVASGASARRCCRGASWLEFGAGQRDSGSLADHCGRSWTVPPPLPGQGSVAWARRLINLSALEITSDKNIRVQRRQRLAGPPTQKTTQ